MSALEVVFRPAHGLAMVFLRNPTRPEPEIEYLRQALPDVDIRVDPKLDYRRDAEACPRQGPTLDKALAQEQTPGPLAGVPFAVKNLFDVMGLPTLVGSKINRDRPPAAALIKRLDAAGAVLVGALNMGE